MNSRSFLCSDMCGKKASQEALLAADALRQRWNTHGLALSPHTAVILGSGLGSVGDQAEREGAISVPYAHIPGMPTPRVPGHAGRFIAGGSRLDGCLLLQGRSHHYEGCSVADITFAVRVLRQLGVRQLIVTNAAGGIRASFRPGDLMLIADHLAMIDLRGLTDSGAQERNRLPIWDNALRKLAAGITTSLTVHSGVYAMMPGPNYETPAEVRMLRRLGADAVGMSTVPEALLARVLGMHVLGVSCITNVAAGLSGGPLNHDEVNATATAVETEFTAWLYALLARLTPDS